MPSQISPVLLHAHRRLMLARFFRRYSARELALLAEACVEFDRWAATLPQPGFNHSHEAAAAVL